jgi:hypothetical protein
MMYNLEEFELSKESAKCIIWSYVIILGLLAFYPLW